MNGSSPSTRGEVESELTGGRLRERGHPKRGVTSTGAPGCRDHQSAEPFESLRIRADQVGQVGSGRDDQGGDTRPAGEFRRRATRRPYTTVGKRETMAQP